MLSQTEWVLSQLKRGRKLTAKQAMDRRGIMRLGARIYDVRRKLSSWNGHIDTTVLRVTNRYGQVCHVAQYEFIPYGS